MKNIFEKEKIAYKNIEIPEELEFIVIKSINEGKKKNSNHIKLISKVLVASLIIFFILLNTSPRFSTIAKNLPIVGKLAELLIIDKGFNNAVEDGFIQNIGYENEINGIKLKVNNLVGDYKSMWIEYEVEEGYIVEVDLTDLKEEDKISAFYSYNQQTHRENENYIEVNFEKFEKDFLMKFNVYNKDKSEVLAIFKVPIELDNKFGENNSSINKKIISTKIGEFEIKGVNTSKTRTSITFKLNSDEYNFVKFENPVLIDSKGNEYKNSRLLSYLNGDKMIEFEGEVKDTNITFKVDNIFYDKKYDKKVIVDLNKKLVQDNQYNTTFESYENNILELKTSNVEGIEFKKENNEYKFNSQSAHGVEVPENIYKIYEVITRFDIFDEGDGTIEINIDSITKDKVKGFKVNIN
ncbi:DUF4179 domain-containing protein [Clostridium sp.]|uniref:DUF4179 domain-containing protein n=1 Tax=Clostridium sp. TaxID=1506 RepID=UPI0029124B8A|nr:DUF4179 domain-containing protein [Clostridium sp.]MDU5105956.1 DUF4179 domain-containing protein [Clostridium sp.]